mgnify:CR=1 FL=1
MNKDKINKPKAPEMWSPQYDPLGMYTGNSAEDETPQQDADDL